MRNCETNFTGLSGATNRADPKEGAEGGERRELFFGTGVIKEGEPGTQKWDNDLHNSGPRTAERIDLIKTRGK